MMLSQRRPAAHAGLVVTLIILAAVTSPGQVRAEASGYRFEITPTLGYRFGGEFEEVNGDTTVELDDSSTFGLIFNGRDAANTQWEVYYARQATSADTATVPGLGAETDLELQVLQVGGTYRGNGDRLRPFLSAGFGGTYIAPDVSTLDSETYWSFSIGTGLQFFTSERWGLRLEARGIGTLVDTDSALFCVSDSGAVCAFRIEGRVLWQFETFAGVTFRF